MISPERMETLQGSWVRLLVRFDVSPAEAYPLFDRLVAAYSESHRHYHTIEHLTDMFRVIVKLSDQLRDPAPVYLAAWYHDAIYLPLSRENEVQSAIWARTELEAIGIPQETIAEVQRLIRCTDHREGHSIDESAAVLLDADLAILGAEQKRYQRYSAAIRREYEVVSDLDYRQGRSTVLQKFLESTRIYRTERMFAVGEGMARENLRREWEVLQGSPYDPHNRSGR